MLKDVQEYFEKESHGKISKSDQDSLLNDIRQIPKQLHFSHKLPTSENTTKEEHIEFAK